MTSCVILSSGSVLTAIRFQPPLCLFLPRSDIVIRSCLGEERGGGERTGPAQHVGYYYIRLPGWLCGDQHIRKYLVGVQAWGSEALLAIMIETYWELHGCLPALDLDYDQVEPDNKWRHPEIYIRILDMWDVRLWEQQTSVPCYCEVYQRPKYLFIAERLSSSTGTRGWNLKIYTNTDHQSDRV